MLSPLTSPNNTDTNNSTSQKRLKQAPKSEETMRAFGDALSDFLKFMEDSIIKNIDKLTKNTTKNTTIEPKKAISELNNDSIKAKRFKVKTLAQWDILRNEIKKIENEETRDTKDNETQTTNESDTDKQIAQIRNTLQHETDSNNIIRAIRSNWHPQTFQSTQLTNSSFLEKRDVRIIIIRDNNTRDLGPIKQLDYQLPNTKEITQKIHPGQTAMITCYSESTCIIDNHEDTNTSPKPKRITLIIGKVHDNEGAEGMIRIVKKVSKQAKQILVVDHNLETSNESQEKMHPMIHFPKNYDQNLARKITEYVWCKSKTPILIATKNKTRNSGPKKDSDKNK